MKINLPEKRKAHLALRYRAIVLYVALLITRWFGFDKMRKEGGGEE